MCVGLAWASCRVVCRRTRCGLGLFIEPCAPDDLGALYHSGDSLLQAFARFHGRVLAELADNSQFVEAKLGLPTLASEVT